MFAVEMGGCRGGRQSERTKVEVGEVIFESYTAAGVASV